MIAAISFGVPRDIIRRCDELLAREDFDRVQPWQVSQELRERQAKLAYGEQILIKRELLDFSSEPSQAVKAINNFFSSPKEKEQLLTVRVALSIWVLTLLTVSANLPQKEWENFSEQLRDIGYRIPEEAPEILVEELSAVQKVVLPQSSIA